MTTPSLTEIIATRTLDGPDGPVRVLIGRPAPFEDSEPDGDYFCPFRIEGIEDTHLELFAGGVDSVQALILALGMIGDRLKSVAKDLTFLGYPELGFPVSERIAEDSTRLTVEPHIA